MSRSSAAHRRRGAQPLRITEGRHFDFYKWQRDRDRLQKLFVERGFFEARLTARRDPPAPSRPQPGQLAPVDLGYTIETGPPTELRITGMDLPDERPQDADSALAGHAGRFAAR